MNRFNFLFTRFFLFLFALCFFQPHRIDAASNETDIKKRLRLGNPNSPIEIYVVSDWYCPSCRKMEPKLEDIYPEFQSKASFYFIDHPIHRKGANFIPYHLALLINEKKKYLDVRQALLEVSEQTENPTDEAIAAALKKQGIQFKELSFADVKSGTEFFEDVIQQYNVNVTPTVVIVNTKTGQFEKLKGGDISEQKIGESIKALEAKKVKKWYDFFSKNE